MHPQSFSWSLISACAFVGRYVLHRFFQAKYGFKPQLVTIVWGVPEVQLIRAFIAALHSISWFASWVASKLVVLTLVVRTLWYPRHLAHDRKRFLHSIQSALLPSNDRVFPRLSSELELVTIWLFGLLFVAMMMLLCRSVSCLRLRYI